MRKIELFEKICDFRVSSYPLQDIHLIKDDWIVGMEEKWLRHFGYDYEEYQGWKSYGEDIENEDEEIQVNIRHKNGELICKLPPNQYTISSGL